MVKKTRKALTPRQSTVKPVETEAAMTITSEAAAALEAVAAVETAEPTPVPVSAVERRVRALEAPALAAAVLAEVPRYQTHTWQGTVLNEGICGLERRPIYRKEDFEGKRVLDLGCATGADLFYTLELGAVKAVGVDRLTNNVQTANRLIKIFGVADRMSVLEADLSDGAPVEIVCQEWDVVICSAIMAHVGWRQLWHNLIAGVVYVIGSADGAPYKLSSLLSANNHGEFLGKLPNNATDKRLLRPAYRITRS
jgi:SAM-dependent methyltransferase